MRAHTKAFCGTQASMVLDREGYTIVKEVPAGNKVTSKSALVNAEEHTAAADDHLDHFAVFLDNLRRGRAPEANLETCQDATTLGHLMNISWEVGRSIRWDGAQNRVSGDTEAQAKVLRPYRAPWKLEV
jgi:hypothetical protein